MTTSARLGTANLFARACVIACVLPATIADPRLLVLALRTASGHELLYLADDRIAHLPRGHDLGALRLDVGGAQPLRERGRDRLIDLVGLLGHIERIA